MKFHFSLHGNMALREAELTYFVMVISSFPIIYVQVLLTSVLPPFWRNNDFVITLYRESGVLHSIERHFTVFQRKPILKLLTRWHGSSLVDRRLCLYCQPIRSQVWKTCEHGLWNAIFLLIRLVRFKLSRKSWNICARILYNSTEYANSMEVFLELATTNDTELITLWPKYSLSI